MVKYDRVDRQKREQADEYFERHKKDAEGYGQEAEMARRKGQLWTAKGYEEKARTAQKQMVNSLEWKNRDNTSKGRTFMDGKEY